MLILLLDPCLKNVSQNETANIYFATKPIFAECFAKWDFQYSFYYKILAWRMFENKTNPKTKKTKKSLTRLKQTSKQTKTWPYERNGKTKKRQTNVNAMQRNQKTKNKFDHMEVFDKVLDTSYPQKAPLLNKPLIKYIYFTPFILNRPLLIHNKLSI